MALAPIAYLLYTRVMKHNPAQPGLVRPRPLRALRRSRVDAPLLDAPPDRLRHHAGGPEELPPARQPHGRPPRARGRRRARGRGHHRPARPGDLRTRWGSRWPSGCSPPASTAAATRSSTTTPTRSRATATCRRAWPRRPARWPATSGLGRLIVFYDDNQIQLDGPDRRWPSPRTWASATRPTAGTCRTWARTSALERIEERDRGGEGRGRPALADHRSAPTSASARPTSRTRQQAHGSPLGEDEVRLTKEAYGWPTPTPSSSCPTRRSRTSARPCERGAEAEEEWDERARRLPRASTPTLADELSLVMDGAPARGLGRGPADASARTTSRWPPARRPATVIQWAAAQVPHAGQRLGRPGALHADRRSRTAATSSAATTPGRNMHYGVREHGDGRDRQRARPARLARVRLDVLQLPRLHEGRDAAGGADAAAGRSTSSRTTRSASARTGPTHQPVEQLAAPARHART